MQVLINSYLQKHLSLSDADAQTLHQKYYKDYGLAVSGLVLHHKIDPLEFNKEVDDALPLENIITPNPQLRQLLDDIDKSKVRLWLFTNAHITHAQRVVKLLGVEDMFEGLTYCDYSKVPLHPKPHTEAYEKAEAESGVLSIQECFFIGKYINKKITSNRGVTVWLLICTLLTELNPDDSHLNCRYAQQRGWTTVHLLEPEDLEPEVKAAKHQIRDLEELRDVFPEIFKKDKSDPPHGSLNSQL
ncbi:MAG: hypothetical protein HETSPECPRED_006330 [Heterodermia speciosa]|uniref:Pyrimidine 5-nucleotidase n=1 Tax=Heterodermia speciosa TaxID=116794 RepID=A0A8H3IP90_9LECA|nr:MAG: hypothetical protein HETSPECPRED_006330 [Heterodermia speciosa]